MDNSFTKLGELQIADSNSGSAIMKWLGFYQVDALEIALMNILSRLFEQRFHAPAAKVQPLQGHLGGSGRQIIRLSNDSNSAIGIVYGAREENVAFLEFSKHFHKYGLPVPEIYGEDLNHGVYLEEDLGDTTLFEFLSKNRSGETIAPAVVDAYRKAVTILPRFQVEAGRDLNYEACYPIGSFDRQSVAWDLNYFKYYFLRLAGVPFNEQALEHDFGRLTDFLMMADRDYFLYRDFQSRNIMLCDGQPFFVDYQGGRKGALQYDIASILFDAKADLPPSLRQELLEHYLDALGRYINLDRQAFLKYYYAYVYVRILQALGAYGFRGFYERKAHFLQSVPFALKNVRWMLHHAVAADRVANTDGRVAQHAGLRKIAGPHQRSGKSHLAHLQFFVSPGAAEGRDRPRRRIRFRCAESAESGAGRTIQAADRAGCPGDGVFEPTGKRASVPGQCAVAGGLQRGQLPAARI